MPCARAIALATANSAISRLTGRMVPARACASVVRGGMWLGLSWKAMDGCSIGSPVLSALRRLEVTGIPQFVARGYPPVVDLRAWPHRAHPVSDPPQCQDQRSHQRRG